MSRDAALEVMDALGRRVVAAAAPLAFRRARSEGELEAVFRLRYRVCVDRGWVKAEELPDGVERDAYDERAIHLTAWDGERLAALCRIVLPEPGRRLPVEATFDLVLEPPGQVVDLGRVAVADTYRGNDRRVLSGLVGCAWLEARSLGFHDCSGVASKPMLELYRRAGLEMTVLGPPRLSWGEWRMPIQIDVVRTAERVIRRAQREPRN